jgi:hypothetical protein
LEKGGLGVVEFRIDPGLDYIGAAPVKEGKRAEIFHKRKRFPSFHGNFPKVHLLALASLPYKNVGGLHNQVGSGPNVKIHRKGPFIRQFEPVDGRPVVGNGNLYVNGFGFKVIDSLVKIPDIYGNCPVFRPFQGGAKS